MHRKGTKFTKFSQGTINPPPPSPQVNRVKNSMACNASETTVAIICNNFTIIYNIGKCFKKHDVLRPNCDKSNLILL